MNRVERTSEVEVQRFCDNHLPTVATYTQPAFSEARYKLKPEVVTDLDQVLIENFYADRTYRTVEGWIPVAIDGSVLEIPNTAILREAYGTASGIARARISHAYDVANRLCVSAILDRYDTSERDLARRNIAEVREIVPKSHRLLWLEDRGYSSFPSWMEFDSQAEAYLMRVPSNFYPKEFATVRRDERVTITVTSDRAREFAEPGHPIPVGTQLTLRVIKRTSSTGDTEILATKVFADELPYASVAVMYHLRWGVENHFDVLKNRCEIANFCEILPPPRFSRNITPRCSSVICVRWSKCKLRPCGMPTRRRTLTATNRLPTKSILAWPLASERTSGYPSCEPRILTSGNKRFGGWSGFFAGR